jgi:alpha/beta superfamily hydrolase
VELTSTFSLAGPETPSARSSLRAIDLHGRAGRLEALLNEGAPGSRVVALVCHPHPLGGGAMHNKVVYHAAKVLNAPKWGLQLPVLRFNFRGTGLSDGLHDGLAESEDVVTALQWLRAEYDLPIIVVGFSFGAAMALVACCSRGEPSTKCADIRALAALGLPTHAPGRQYNYSSLSGCAMPKLFLSGDRDQFASEEELQQVVASAAEPKTLAFIPNADHFFTGRLESMQQALASWVKEHVA